MVRHNLSSEEVLPSVFGPSRLREEEKWIWEVIEQEQLLHMIGPGERSVMGHLENIFKDLKCLGMSV